MVNFHQKNIRQIMTINRIKMKQGVEHGHREGRREPAFSDRGGDRGDRPRRRRN
jgi:hypothetical protein